MKIYRKAIDTNIEHQAIRKIFDSLVNLRGSRFESPTGQVTKDYVEFEFYDVYGEAYIQVSFSEKDHTFRIEKYYENEMAQDDYGEIVNVPFDVTNVEKTLDSINGIIESWTEKSNKPEEREDNLSDVDADAMT